MLEPLRIKIGPDKVTGAVVYSYDQGAPAWRVRHAGNFVRELGCSTGVAGGPVEEDTADSSTSRLFFEIDSFALNLGGELAVGQPAKADVHLSAQLSEVGQQLRARLKCHLVRLHAETVSL